jgi:hypothetical protein
VSAPTGGNQGYQGLGYYGGGEPPKKRNGLLIAVVVAAVVLIGVTATLLIIGVKNTTPGEALAAESTQRDSSAPRPTTSRDPLQPQATGAPLVPGWKPVAINDGKQIDTTKAYDVPPDWQPLNSTASFGSTPKTTMYIPTIYMKGYCNGSTTSFRSMAGLILVPNKGDVPAQATAAAQQIADAVFTTSEGLKPKVDLGQPQAVSVDRDKKGFTVTAKATLQASQKDKCNAANAVVTVMLLEPRPGDETSLVLTAFADQGFPEATSEQHLLQIVTSIHAAN